MLIKFSKQIANNFSKIINGYKDEFKTLSNICDGAFTTIRYWLQRQTQNIAKHLRRSFLQKIVKNKKPFTIFGKTSNLDV